MRHFVFVVITRLVEGDAILSSNMFLFCDVPFVVSLLSLLFFVEFGTVDTANA